VADAEHIHLRLVRIGHEPAEQNFRRPGNLGNRGGDQPPGAALREREFAAERLVGLDDLARQGNELGGQDGIDAHGRAVADAAAPAAGQIENGLSFLSLPPATEAISTIRPAVLAGGNGDIRPIARSIVAQSRGLMS